MLRQKSRVADNECRGGFSATILILVASSIAFIFGISALFLGFGVVISFKLYIVALLGVILLGIA